LYEKVHLQLVLQMPPQESASPSATALCTQLPVINVKDLNAIPADYSPYVTEHIVEASHLDIKD
jgi:hypothetical protein